MAPSVLSLFLMPLASVGKAGPPVDLPYLAAADTAFFSPVLPRLPNFLDPERATDLPPVAFLGLKPIRGSVDVHSGALHLTPRPELTRPVGWVLQPGALRLRRSVERGAEDLRSRWGGMPPPDARRLERVARLRGEPAPAASISDGISSLDVQLVGLAELGGDWTRFRPCDTSVQFRCEPSLIPQLNPDLQFRGQIQGVVADRINVDVDFDQSREFSAANNISIVYEGMQNEILQRLEVGDVTFDLPASRFLTQGIPAGNFGFMAAGQLGPVDVRGVWAQQRGDLNTREFRLSGSPGEEAFVQVDTLVLDDADFVAGQFFFLVPPEDISGFPHIDVLDLDPSRVSSSIAPGIEPIQLYRFEADPVARQQVNGLIQADAEATLGTDVVREAGWFRYLQPGVDYAVHPSGLWFALRRPLRRDEVLAATYITATGDTVGDYNPERIYNAGLRPELRLLKAANASHQPGRPTWNMEMHQVYRASSSVDVDPRSVGLTISLGELSAGQTFKRTAEGADLTLLRLFGLDEEAPVDEVDPAGVFQFAQDFSDQPPAVPGVFIIFPTLRPFQAPPPLESLNLTALETADILGSDMNSVIYEAEDPFDRDSGGRFRLTIPFELRSEGLISSFSLGALGIRDGSERILLGDRILIRDVDYEIDYDVGQVNLIAPNALFAAAVDPVVRASWEQKTIFQVAPTSVVGLEASWRAGRSGSINLLGLRQTEQTLVRRPELGLEPSAITLGGLNGAFSFPSRGLDRMLESVPGLRLGGPSRIDVDAEIAVSLPNPNTRRDAFLDDFDVTNQRSLSLRNSDWAWGSAPVFRDGAETVFPAGLDESDAARMAWQHTWLIEGSNQDSLGVFEGFLPRVDIDQQIQFTGSEFRETGLLVSFGTGPRGAGQTAWRSITTTLSTTGLDLSKSEFLEFYVAEGEDLTLVLDLGNVSEDVVFVDSIGRVSGVKSTGVPWGIGRLDQEADPLRGEVWSDVLDHVGVWGEDCLAERAAVYSIGDPKANCTRGNGRVDSEDLDGDGSLDTQERYLRFVVTLDAASPFLTRSTAQTGTAFQLFRIPLRGPDAIPVPGVFTEADFRAVKHLRMTVVGTASRRLTLARMRFSGSRWIKRAEDGVVTGILGDTAAFFGRAEVGPVSAVTDGGTYTAPPGVIEGLEDPSSVLGGQGIEFNEKGLKIEYSDVGPGDRAEVFRRFPQRPRDFLAYRRIRLWGVGVEGDWGPDAPLFFFLKVGEDPENFYLYRTPLPGSSTPGGAQAQDWLPEILIDFEEWFELRQRAEEELIARGALRSDEPLQIWSADSTYSVVMKDRARAPNLAAVRELSLGVWNGLDQPTSGEVWVNELRLSEALTNVGVAGHLSLNVEASDVISVHLSASSRGGEFRQLAERPTFQRDRQFSLNSTVRLDRLAPSSWGVDIPLRITHTERGQSPEFLDRSDVRVSRLAGLRKPGDTRTRIDLGFRKKTPTSNPWAGLILDGLDARLGYFHSSGTTITSRAESEGVDARLGFGRGLVRRDVPVVPNFLGPMLRWILPSGLEERVVASRFRWSPERISFNTSYSRVRADVQRFDQIVEADDDSIAVATQTPRESLESVAEIAFRPFSSLRAQANLTTTRDLLAPPDLVADTRVQGLIDDELSQPVGLNLGWETNRLVRTSLNYAPVLSSWLRTDVNLRTLYATDRNATFVDERVEGTDTLLSLQRNISAQKNWTGGVTLTPAGLPVHSGGLLSSMTSLVQPVTFTWRQGITTRFNRDPVDPGIGFQFGFGGVDDFRFIDGDTAATVTELDRFGVRSGLALPAGIRLGVNYDEATTTTLDTRSDRADERRTWPDLSLRVASLTLPSELAPFIRSISFSTGYRKSTQKTTFGGADLQQRNLENRQIPVQVTTSWVGGMTLAYQGSFNDRERSDPTGDTDENRSVHAVTIGGSFVPPGGIAGALQAPITGTVSFQYMADRRCRAPEGSPDCIAFIDQLIRSLQVRLGTQLSQMNVRMQLTYIDQRSFVGLRTGSTQFQFGLFGEFTVVGSRLGG